MKTAKVAVLIAERNEPDLDATIANIEENSNATVLVFSDDEGIGPQRARDNLIGQAAAQGAEVCIVMDGHMRVQAETIPIAAAFVHLCENTVAVAHCFHGSGEPSFDGRPYAAAKLVDKSQGKDAHEPQSFVGKWRKTEGTEREFCQVGCVMGAFYAFRTDWYMDGLRRPWQYGTGWGCDEEIISAATWLRGGSVHLLPVDVWHRARGPGEVPYKLTRRQLQGVWANRLRILYQMPMPEAMRRELVENICVVHNYASWEPIVDMANLGAALDYRDFLAEGPMKWEEFERRIINQETVI
jgi:hypothetical protein